MSCRYHRCGYPIIVLSGAGDDQQSMVFRDGHGMSIQDPLTHCPDCRRLLAADDLLTHPPDPARLITNWTILWPTVKQQIEARLAAEMQAQRSPYLYHPETAVREFEASLQQLFGVVTHLQHLPILYDQPGPLGVTMTSKACPDPLECTLLVPLDGSPDAEAALPHAVRVASATGWGICLVYVMTNPALYSALADPDPFGMDPVPLWEQAQTSGQAYLEQIAAQLKPHGMRTTVRLLEGDPATALLAYVSQEPSITMIVMATHGRSGIQHLLFGSVAEKILPITPVPLLLVRCQEPVQLAESAPYSTIMVPLDGSTHAEHALLLAHTLAHKTTGDLLLMHTIPISNQVTLAHLGYNVNRDQQHVAQVRARAGAYLQAKAAIYAAAGTPVRVLVRDGHAGEQIVAAAREAGADLIVLATHGLTGLRRLWLGSTATYVVRHSTIPVLLVRQDMMLSLAALAPQAASAAVGKPALSTAHS